MFSKSLKRWLMQRFQRPERAGGTGRRKPRQLVLERLEERLAPVVGATAIPDPIVAPSAYDGVVEIVGPKNAIGSGSLLYDGMHILTAAHVVSAPDKTTERSNGQVDSGTFKVYFFLTSSIGSGIEFDVPSSAVTIAPGFDGSAADGNDLAILQLPSAAPAGAQHYDLYRGANDFGPSSPNFTLVGYGLTGTGTSGATSMPGDVYNDKREGQNHFDTTDASGKILNFDFDDGTAANNHLGDLGLGASEAMMASGDSGGPDLVGNQIVGVHSYTTVQQPDCGFGTIGSSVRVSQYAGWIDGIINNSSYDLMLDMTKEPGSSDGMQDTVRADRNGSNLELLVNGQVVYSYDVSHVKSLTITGSKDQDAITVTSDLDIQVTVTGIATQEWTYLDGTPLPPGAMPDPQNAGSNPWGDAPTYKGDPIMQIDVNQNTLTVEDDTPSDSLEVSRQQVAFASETIQYTGMSSLAVETDADTSILSANLTTFAFQIESTPSGGLTLDAGSSAAVTVGDVHSGLDSIGALTVNGGAGTTLSLDDEADQNQTAFVLFQGGGEQLTTFGHSPSFDVTGSDVTFTDQWTVKDQTVVSGQRPSVQDTMTGTSIAHIQYAAIDRLTITGATRQAVVVQGVTLDVGSTGNVFNVEGTSAAVVLNAGAGQDTVHVGAAAQLLQNVGSVTVNGGGNTTLDLNDQNNAPVHLSPSQARNSGFGLNIATNPQYTVTDHVVTRTDEVIATDAITGALVYDIPVTTTVTYSNVTGVVINGGASDDVFTVQSTHANIPVSIYASGGSNTVTVDHTDAQGNKTLGDDVHVFGDTSSSANHTTLYIDDHANPSTPYVITAAGQTIIGDPITISYSGVQAVTLAGAISGSYDIEGVPAGTTFTLNPGSGTNTFNPAALAQPPAGLTLNAAGSDLVLDDSASTADSTYTITATTVQVNDLPPISYSGAHSLSVLGGSGNDTFIVEGLSSATPVTLTAGNGSSNFTVVMGNLLGPVTLQGSTGATQVTVEAPAGSNVLTLSPTQLTGAGEMINFALGSTLTGLKIDGSAGSNQLVTQGAPPGPLTLTNVVVATTTSASASAATPLLGQLVTFTASVSTAIAVAGQPSGSVTFEDGSTVLGTAPLVNGQAAWTTSGLAVGAHTITAVYGGAAGFLSSDSSASLTVLPPASLSGLVFEDFNDDGQVDFGEQSISGVTITLTGTDDLGQGVNLSQKTDSAGTYLFGNLRPGQYTLSETQPAGYVQGIDSVGTADGSLAATDQFFVQLAQGVNGINYNYGEQPPAGAAVQRGQTAGIGFWHNKNGQALIQALNGDTGTQLGDWLAATLPSIYGAQAGSSNLSGTSNAAVASLFQQDFLQQGPKLDAQVLATALAVYVTNASLDPNRVAAQYGFTVSGDGVGAATVNVGSSGAAFGVANNTTLTVLDLLLATNAQAVNGVLYDGNTARRSQANSVCDAVNQAGAIS